MNRIFVALCLFFVPCLLLGSITSTTDRSGPYTIGSLPATLGTFPFVSSSDLAVIDTGQSSAPRFVTLALNSDYTVSGGGYSSLLQMQAGSVVVNGTGSNKVIAGDQIVIIRNVPFNQTTSLLQSGSLTVQNIEQALDKSATLSQELLEDFSRTLQFIPGDTSSGAIPSPATRANTTMGFGPDGALRFTPTTTQIIPAAPLLPESYGAVGNGVADDTSAVQAAINAAEATNRTLLLDAKYRTTSALVIGSSCSITGTTSGQILYDGTGSAFPNNHAILIQSTIATSVTTVVQGSAPGFNTTSITMTSQQAGNFTVGDNVFIQYGVDLFDPNQPVRGYFTVVTAVGSTSITVKDGFPEASTTERLAYTNLSGTINQGDTLTQGGTTATAGIINGDSIYAYPRIAVSGVSGTFSAGTLTDSTTGATATLVVPFSGASTVDAGYSIYVAKLSTVAENVTLDNLDVEGTFNGSMVCSGAVCVNEARNVTVRNLHCGQMTVGVNGLYTYNLHVLGESLDYLVTYNTVLPKAVGGWNQVGTFVSDVYANTTSFGIFIESQCRDCYFTNLNFYRSGADTSDPVLVAAQGCRGVVFSNVQIQAVPSVNPLTAYLLVDPNTDVRYNNIALNGNIAVGVPLARVDGNLTVPFSGSQTVYRNLRHQLFKISPQASQSSGIFLPNGLYRSMRIYYSTSTGLSSIFITGSGGSESGQGESISTIPPPSGGGWDTCPAFCAYSPGNAGISQKTVNWTTGSSWPSGAYMVIDAEFWPNESSSANLSQSLNTPTPTDIQWGTSTPVSAVTPRYLGDEYINTTSGDVWFANGLTNTKWVKGFNPSTVSNVSIPDSTATTLAAFSTNGVFLVSTVLDVNSWAAYAIVGKGSGGSWQILGQGGSATYSFSGSNLQITQASGSASTTNMTSIFQLQ